MQLSHFLIGVGFPQISLICQVYCWEDKRYAGSSYSGAQITQMRLCSRRLICVIYGGPWRKISITSYFSNKER
ncbi:MAG: hypothetical protein DI535_16325 [Citrobacter freundii]|nr:MAG: hypothetical protein DI535_16325 [Citrobacter freundii]